MVRATYLGLPFSLHLKRFWHLKTLLCRGPIVDLIEPLLDQSELFDVDPSALCPIDPTEASQISGGHLVTNDPRALRPSFRLLAKTVLENLVKPLCFGLVAPDPFLDLLWYIAIEVVCLTLSYTIRVTPKFYFSPKSDLRDYLHRARTTLHAGQPFRGLPVFIGIVRVPEHMIPVVTPTNVKHQSPGFKDMLFSQFAVCRGRSVDSGMYPPVGLAFGGPFPLSVNSC